MWNNKLKAFTLSFDDGVMQDIKTIEILNKYGIKATFNLNSGLLGCKGEKRNFRGKFMYREDKVNPNKVKEIYAGHEVAVHTLTHPNLTTLTASAITYQVETDRKILSELCGYEVVGMAYPCGDTNSDDRVAEVIKSTTGVKYARTNLVSNNFDISENLLLLAPTIPVYDFDALMKKAKEFIDLKTETPKMFYVLGHAFEFDAEGGITWAQFEEFCKYISGKEDIFYGTNAQVLLGE